MTYTGIALLGYILWTILLLIALAIYRTGLVQSKQRNGLKFSPDGTDVPAFGNRLTRAQANCSESFAVVGGALLYSLAVNATAVTDSLALVLLGARIGQSIVHLISTNNLAIQLRFVLFLAQIGIVIYWILRFFGVLG